MCGGAVKSNHLYYIVQRYFILASVVCAWEKGGVEKVEGETVD